MIEVRFTYLTGQKRRSFRRSRLRGSWDSGGRSTDQWADSPMQEIAAEDGCPAFTASIDNYGASIPCRNGHIELRLPANGFVVLHRR